MAFRYKKYLIFAFALALCSSAHAAFAQIIFTEAMYDLPGTDDGREWIEIRNIGDEAVDMSKWKLFENSANHKLTVAAGATALPPQSIAIIADDSSKFLIDWPDFSGTIYDSAFSLSNSGEEISLKDENLAVAADFIYLNAQGANGDGNSLEYAGGSWSAGSPTPGETNEIAIIPPPPPTPDPEPAPEPSPSPDGTPILEPAPSPEPDPTPEPPPDPVPSGENNPAPADETPDISIHEIMYDLNGTDDGREWVEVFNAGDSDIDLSDWKFSEGGTNHGLTLAQGSSIIPPAGFAVIVSDSGKFKTDWPDFSGTVFDSAFSLSNSGESIALKNHNLENIDELNYSDFLIRTGDGNSLQKIGDEWVSAAPTPGAENISASSADSGELGGEDTGTKPEPIDPASEKIKINEIAWMGTEGNQYGEWIELYNEGDTEIDVNGWKLYKDGGDTLVFALTEKIPAKEYLAIERTTDSSPDPLPDIDDEAGTFGGGLANLPKGEHLVLKDAAGNIIQDFDFSASWPAGDNTTKDTMQLFDGGWITAKPTPKKANTDHRTKLPANSSSGSGYSPAEDAALPQESGDIQDQIMPAAIAMPENKIKIREGDVIISEVGAEDDLFVKIFNILDTEMDLSGWKITSPKKSFTIPEHTIILSGKSISFSQKITGFSSDEISDLQLVSPESSIIFSYLKSIEQHPVAAVSAQNEISRTEETVKNDISSENKILNSQVAAVAGSLLEDGIPKRYYYLGSAALLAIISIIRIFI